MVRLLILLIVIGVIIWLITMVVLRFAPGGPRPPRSGAGDQSPGPHGGWDPPPGGGPY